MDNNFAEATCILKVNIHCQACKMKLIEVLGSVCGEYSFELNSDEGLVKIFALVDPNLLMKAISRTGNHAELKSVRLQHPRVSGRSYYGHTGSGYGGGYNNHGGALEYPPQQGLGWYGSHNNVYPTSPYSSYPSQNYFPPQPYSSDPYGYGPGASPAGWSGACNRPRPFGGPGNFGPGNFFY